MTFVSWNAGIYLRESLHVDLGIILLLLHCFELMVIRFDFVFVVMIAGYVCEGLHLLLGIMTIMLTSMVVPGTILMHA